MTEAELSKITSDFHMTKPFRRKSFIAMLLGFYPCDYTLDYEDNEIMYGQKSFDKFDEDMNYISCKRLLLKFGFRDEKLIHKLYEENRKNLMIFYMHIKFLGLHKLKMVGIILKAIILKIRSLAFIKKIFNIDYI